MSHGSVPPVDSAFIRSSTPNDGVVIFRRVIPVVGAPEGSVVASAKRRPGLPTRSTKIGGTFLMSSLVPAKSSFSTSIWEATCSSERLSVSAR